MIDIEPLRFPLMTDYFMTYVCDQLLSHSQYMHVATSFASLEIY